MKRVIRECRGCKKTYSTPSPWPGCCSEACLVKRLDYLELSKPEKNKLKKERKLARRNGFDPTSRRWLSLRYEALVLHGRTCLACGRKSPEVVLQVDHIRPRSKYPELTWDLNNLQVLCRDCNQGKSDVDQSDFRA